MGRRGPPPKPASKKKAQGTYRKDRDRAARSALAALPPDAPAVPKGLPAAARQRWLEIVPELHRAGMLAGVDGGVLETYCRAFARWRTLESAAGRAPIVKTPFGPKANPAGVEARKVSREVIQPLEVALGLHYAARSRVKAPDKGEQRDAVEEDLFGPLKAIEGGKL